MTGLRGQGVILGIWLAITFAFFAAPALADEPPPEVPAASEPQGPPLPWKMGPAPLELGHDVKLALPEGYQFLGMPEADELLKKNGSLHNDGLLGMVVPSTPGDEYFVLIRYDEEGYVKDDEELDGKALLEAMQDGEEEYNAERQKLGFTPIHAAGWLDDPKYDKALHHVVWALIVTDPQGESINYNTRILGRRGYASLNLVTGRETLARDKVAAATLLRATTFNSGARYEDFNSSTDKVAEYGLAGLVVGGLGLGLLKVAKIGLLAKFGKVIIAALLVGKKAIVAAVIGGIALLKKFFGRKASDAA